MASEGEAGSAAATETEPGEGYGSFVYSTVLSVMIFGYVVEETFS